VIDQTECLGHEKGQIVRRSRDFMVEKNFSCQVQGGDDSQEACRGGF